MTTQRIAVQFTVQRTVEESVELANGETATVTRMIEEIVTQWIEVEVETELDATQEEELRQLVTDHITIDDEGGVQFEREDFEAGIGEMFADSDTTISAAEIDALETLLENVDERVDDAITDEFVLAGPRATIDRLRLVSEDDFGIIEVPPGDQVRADLTNQLATGVYLTTGVPNPNIAAEVVDGLVRAMNEGRVSPELVMPLAQAAASGDKLAAAALFGLAFDDLDGDDSGESWTNATGCGWLGGVGGNCATFVSCAYLYVGLSDDAIGWDPNDATIPNGDARGASELSYQFLTNWGSNRGDQVEAGDASLRPGDFIYQGSELQDLPPDDEFDHVSMVVGFGPAEPAPGAPVFGTYDEAAAYYADLNVEVTAYVVDHNPDNYSGTPRPWNEANPFQAATRFGVRINDLNEW